jgi:hydroxymethylglutaryl-CoA lyase
MGLETGIDLPALFAARETLRRSLPESEELYGFTPLAGLPLGFRT